jgi:hypothetical protein
MRPVSVGRRKEGLEKTCVFHSFDETLSIGQEGQKAR